MARTRKKKEAPEQNPYEVPLYTLWDVARYLRIPIWVVAVLSGQRLWIERDLFFHNFIRVFPFPHLFDDDSSSARADTQFRVSFRRFAVMFVRAGVVQAFSEQPLSVAAQSDLWDALQRRVWRGLEDTLNDPIPFDDLPIEVRVHQIAAPFVSGINEREAALVRKHLTIRLERVETKAGQPVRIYPPSREPADAATRVIQIDPKVRFGRPTLKGRGQPTDTLYERHQAGDSIAHLAADYDISAGEVEEAIRYESRQNTQVLPFYGW